MHSRILKLLLLAAVAVPFAYFGSQAVAAPFFPDYSVLTVSASELGSDRSLRPAILNVGAMLTGLLAALGSVGLGVALPRLSVPSVLSWLLAACLASIGLAAAWAGLHPLPSPQHDPGVLGIGMFASPLVSAWAVMRSVRLKALRVPLMLNLGAFGACAWVFSGGAGIDLSAFGGLVQKLAAAVCFVPPAAVAFVAASQLRELRDAR